MTEFGYAGKILKIDLSLGKTDILYTAEYSERFLGGRGIGAKIYWDEVSPETGALEEGNCLVCITGPLAGFTRFAGCRWQICGKSPLTKPGYFSYANFGGSWGAWLKYSGYDGLVIRGKADRPVYILINNDRVEIKDAGSLWGKTTTESQNMLQREHGDDARVLGIGPAGEKLISFATLLASGNASGSSGFGSVMGSKLLKAVVVKTDEKKRPKAADTARLKAIAEKVYQLRTKNYENYLHVDYKRTRRTACYGCISGCDRREYTEEGQNYKYFCQSSAVYLGPAMRYNEDGDGQKVAMLANKLCDLYGLDTAVIGPIIGWLGKCHEAGILREEETGLPLTKIGGSEFIEKLTHMLSIREGFGDLLANGIATAAERIGRGSEKLIDSLVATKTYETPDYDPRFMPVNALIYATEPRRPIQMLHGTALPIIRWVNWTKGHEDAFLSNERLQEIAREYWGSEEAGNFTSFEGKALAATRIQDYGYFKESLIICDLAWPIYQVCYMDDVIGFSTLESQIVTAITGRTFNEEELMKTGERIFNLQRAIHLREGWGGRQGDIILDHFFKEPLESLYFTPECIAPGEEYRQVSKKGEILKRIDFENLKDDYYAMRGWDVKSGLQTKAKLEELGLKDIATTMDKEKLLK